jgi:hypothetical protein
MCRSGSWRTRGGGIGTDRVAPRARRLSPRASHEAPSSVHPPPSSGRLSPSSSSPRSSAVSSVSGGRVQSARLSDAISPGRVRSLVFATAALLGTGAVSASTASAADSTTVRAAQQRVVNKIADASTPSAVGSALSAAERQLLQESLHNQTVKTVYRTGRLRANSPEVQAMGPAAVKAASMVTPAGEAANTVTPNSSGCWYHYQYDSWSDVHVNDGDTWMQLNWCASGGTITSHSVSNYGGKGYYGNEYEGVVSKPSSDVGWEIRQAVEFHFNWFGANAQPCMQIRGGATGLYSTSKTCNLS